MNKRFLVRILTMAFIAVLAAGLSDGTPAAEQYFTVQWVDDGDTIVLEDGRRIRYIGLNAPEVAHEDQPAEPFGEAAKRHNKELVLEKEVRLEPGQEMYDRFGRLLAYVFLRDGTFVNAAMLEQGYAYAYPTKPNDKYEETFLEAQRGAMSERSNMWRLWTEEKSEYIGNSRSKRFHLADCSYGKRTSKKNRVMFEKTWDAFWEGYAPCKQCAPHKEK